MSAPGLDLAGVLAAHDGWSTTGPDDDELWTLICFGCKAEICYLDDAKLRGTKWFDRRHEKHVAAVLRKHIAEWLGGEAVRGVVAQVLINEGGAPGNSIHSWRCEHPEAYGECTCVPETATEVLTALADLARGAS